MKEEKQMSTIDPTERTEADEAIDAPVTAPSSKEEQSGLKKPTQAAQEKASSGQTTGRPAGKADENASKSKYAGQPDPRGYGDKDGNASAESDQQVDPATPAQPRGR